MDPPDTIESLQALLSRSPFDTKLLFRLATAHVSQSDFSSAARILERILRFQKKSGPVLSLLGDCYYWLKEDLKSCEAYEKAERFAEQNREAEMHYRHGLLYMRNGDFKEGLGSLKKALERGRKTSETYLGVGRCKEKLGNVTEAAEAYQKALSLCTDPPERVLCLCPLARCFCKLKQPSDCFSTLAEAEVLAPNDYKIAKLQAWCYLHSDELEAGVAFAQKAVAMSRGEDMADLNGILGVCFMKMDSIDQAYPFVLLSVSLQPSCPCAWTLFGLLYYLKRQYSESFLCYLKSLRLSSRNPAAFLNLSLLYQLSNSPDLAMKCIQTAISIDATMIPAPEGVQYPSIDPMEDGAWLGTVAVKSLKRPVEKEVDISWVRPVEFRQFLPRPTIPLPILEAGQSPVVENSPRRERKEPKMVKKRVVLPLEPSTSPLPLHLPPISSPRHGKVVVLPGPFTFTENDIAALTRDHQFLTVSKPPFNLYLLSVKVNSH